LQSCKTSLEENTITLNQINPAIFWGMGIAIIALLIFAFFVFRLSKKLQVVVVFCATSGLLFFEVMAHLEILPIPIDPNIDAFLMSFLSTIFTILLLGLIIEKINYSKNNLSIGIVSQISPFYAFIGSLIGLTYLLSSIKWGMYSLKTIMPKIWYIPSWAILLHLIGLMKEYCFRGTASSNQNKGE